MVVRVGSGIGGAVQKPLRHLLAVVRQPNKAGQGAEVADTLVRFATIIIFARDIVEAALPNKGMTADEFARLWSVLNPKENQR